MWVVHGIWAREALCLWAEDPDLPPSRPVVASGLALHPFACQAAELADVLAALPGLAGEAARKAVDGELTLQLPSAAGPLRPLASPGVTCGASYLQRVLVHMGGRRAHGSSRRSSTTAKTAAGSQSAARTIRAAGAVHTAGPLRAALPRPVCTARYRLSAGARSPRSTPCAAAKKDAKEEQALVA